MNARLSKWARHNDPLGPAAFGKISSFQSSFEIW